MRECIQNRLLAPEGRGLYSAGGRDIAKTRETPSREFARVVTNSQGRWFALHEREPAPAAMTSLSALHGVVFASLSVVATSIDARRAAQARALLAAHLAPGRRSGRRSAELERRRRACGLLARELGASVLLPTLQRTAATVLSRVLADEDMRTSLSAVSLTARVRAR